MPTLTIGDRKVRVDDAFLRLSTEEQGQSVAAIAGQLGLEGGKRQDAPAAPEGNSSQFGGMALNATAGANEGLYGLAGLPVDLTRGAINLGIRGYNAATGSDVAAIPENSFGGSRYIAETLGGVSPVLDPRNTVASSTEDRVARGAGQGAAGALAPELAARTILEKGIATASPAVTQAAGRIFGTSATGGQAAANAAIGAASGAGGAAAEEAAPDQLKPIASLLGSLGASAAGVGLLAAPMAVREGGKVLRQAAEPLTEAGRSRLAAERLRSSATDVQALRDSLDGGAAEFVPGSKPTTFQATGDMGLGALERGAAARSPEKFMQRRADQNAAQLKAMGGLQYDGAPETVASAIRQHLDDLDAESELMIGAATDAARSRASAIGSPMTPEAAGGDMRSAIEAARAQAKQNERALWDAVDPEGRMTLGLSNTRQSASNLAKELSPLAQPMTDTERQIYGAIGQAGDTVPLRAMQDLQSNLTAAMRAERSTNGESPAYRRMSIVSAGIAKDFDDAVAGRVAQEATAVQSGQMRPQDTFEARWAQEIEAWRDRREAAAGGDGGPAPRGYASGREVGVSGAYGTKGQASRQVGGSTGNPSLSPDAGGTGFDGAAQDRLNAANLATRQRVATFDNPTLRPLRQRAGTNAPYAVPDSSVPGRLLTASPQSFDAIQAYRDAVGDGQALESLVGYAVDRARRAALRDDGTFDPTRLASWRRAYSDALRAMPEIDALLSNAEVASETLAHVTRMQARAREEASRGVLARLIGLDDPSDVTRTVGAIFNRQDAAMQMMRLRSAIGSNKEAQAGLRKAIADHIAAKFVGNTEAATSGLGTVKSDGFQTFVRQSQSALRAAGFSDAEIATMQRVAADLQRANRSIASVKLPGGSNSVQDAIQAGKLGEKPTLLSRVLSNVPTVAGGAGGFFVGGPFTAMAGAVGAKTLADMRKAGIESVEDLVTDALLNPERARLLLTTPSRKTERATWELLGHYYRRAATVGAVEAVDKDDNRKQAGAR